jgi:hypothetical protein
MRILRHNLLKALGSGISLQCSCGIDGVCGRRNDGHCSVPDDNGDNLIIRLMSVQINSRYVVVILVRMILVNYESHYRND